MKIFNILILFFFPFFCIAQSFHRSADGNSYYTIEQEGIVMHTLPQGNKTIIVSDAQLKPGEEKASIKVKNFQLSDDGLKLLIYSNTSRVWRYETKGNYWVYDIKTKKLQQLGKQFPSSSLMFAKFSPDGSKVAYVQGHNLYVENVHDGVITPLTSDGTEQLINGTFDWAYEEEFDCRDGFRWSPDGTTIAYWKIDASKISDFLLINNTDSIYSFTVPVEYPKVGESPSPAYIYTVNIASGNTVKMNIPGDPQQHYIPRMEWAANSSQLVLQQLNRKQNESVVMYCNALNGNATAIYTERDSAWIDVKTRWSSESTGWEWLQGGKEFLWVSEKDGWRHIYLISRDGKEETLVTDGNYDVINILGVDNLGTYVYYIASPFNATQKYLYRISLNGKGSPELLSPSQEIGTHQYDLSPNGLFALHYFSNANLPSHSEMISLPDHNTLESRNAPNLNAQLQQKVEFFKISTEDSITMDGWMVKPADFDSTKKYPVVFFVYAEPGNTTVNDRFGAGYNNLYNGNMSRDGYIYMSVEGRGAPAPKGALWRKSIYKNIGQINIRDQAMAAKKIRQWGFVDSTRIAVWGWSGGGSTTLNLLGQYPDIYATGIAVSAVTNQLTYDNIYQERYMGLPQNDIKPFIVGSPLTYVKNIRGNLLYIHGTGDDNVHYQNAELFLNEVIKHNVQIQFMAYPNRSHGISEGEGTRTHLSTLYTNFLKANCPPGGR